jgi:hypothetical protein
MTQPPNDHFAWPGGDSAADGDPLIVLTPWMLEAALAPESWGSAMLAPSNGGLRLAYASAEEAMAAAGMHRAEEAAARVRLQELRAEDAALAVRERRLRSEASAAPRWRVRTRAMVREQLAVTQAERGEIGARMAEWEAEKRDRAARAGNAELVGRLLAEPERATTHARVFRLDGAASWLASVSTRMTLSGRAFGRDNMLRRRREASLLAGHRRSVPALPPPARELRGPEARQ